MIDAASIAKALGGKVRGGRVYAPGPGHSNKDKSLVVYIDPAAPEGFRVHSFADDWRVCAEYVRDRLGLPKWNGHIDRVDLSGWHAKVYPKKEQQETKGPAREVAAYDYISADGEVLYQAVRYEPKDFRQRRPNGAGGWTYSLEGVQRVLYRLPDLLAHPGATVFFTEGEKDADRLATLGHCATTVAGSTWGDADPAVLAGRDVLILEDNDAKGRERAAKAAERIVPIAKTTRIVRLPGLPERGDVSDFLDADPSHADDLVELCFAAPVISTPSADPGPFRASEFTGTAPARQWVVKDWVAKGVVNSLYGAGGVGKTLLAQQLAYCLGIGVPFLSIPVDRQKVLCVLCEDDRDELHRRHDALLNGLGIPIGNPFKDVLLWPRIGYDNLLVTWNANGDVRQGPAFAAVRDEVLKERPSLLILDTLADFFGGNEIIRPQVNHFLKTLLGGLIVEAGDAGHVLTVLLLAHPSASGMSSGSGTSGSTAWENAVRARLYMRKPADGHQDERELVRAKANYTTSGDESVVRLLWQDGLFVVVGVGKDEIEVRSAQTQILENVRAAWDSGKAFTGKKGHERSIWAKLLPKLNHVKRTVFVQALRQLIEDGEIVIARRGAGGTVRGYKLADQGDDDGVDK